jgi:hypothetical protein
MIDEVMERSNEAIAPIPVLSAHNQVGLSEVDAFDLVDLDRAQQQRRIHAHDGVERDHRTDGFGNPVSRSFVLQQCLRRSRHSSLRVVPAGSMH